MFFALHKHELILEALHHVRDLHTRTKHDFMHFGSECLRGSYYLFHSGWHGKHGYRFVDDQLQAMCDRFPCFIHLYSQFPEHSVRITIMEFIRKLYKVRCNFYELVSVIRNRHNITYRIPMHLIPGFMSVAHLLRPDQFFDGGSNVVGPVFRAIR